MFVRLFVLLFKMVLSPDLPKADLVMEDHGISSSMAQVRGTGSFVAFIRPEIIWLIVAAF